MATAIRLDHLIVETGDIEKSLQTMRSSGYPIAWPVGPFWPNALTCGVCIGGLNLEFLQPKDREPEAPEGRILVFEPFSIAAAIERMEQLGLRYEVREKLEEDPRLLSLRGFTEEESRSTQQICTNLVPLDPPFPFFFCDYAPGLKRRLDPSAFCVASPVRRIVYGLARHQEAMEVIRQLGLALPPLDFVQAEVDRVVAFEPPLPIR